MGSRRLHANVRAALVVALLLAPLALAGAAHAQSGPSATISLTVPDPAMALPPGGEVFLDVYGRYTVANGVAEPNPDPEGDGLQPTRITFSVKEMPSWILAATIEPESILVSPNVPNGDTHFRDIRVRLNVSPDAPALQREEIVIQADSDPNGLIPAGHGESPAIKLRAAEVPRVNVTGPSSPYVMPGGVWNDVVFTVTNAGNKDTRVLLNVTVRPEMSEVEFPNEIELGVGESADVVVRVRTPWTEREVGSLELEAIPLTEDDVGPATRLALDVSGESAVPGLSPAGVLLVLVGVVLVLRRRG